MGCGMYCPAIPLARQVAQSHSLSDTLRQALQNTQSDVTYLDHRTHLLGRTTQDAAPQKTEQYTSTTTMCLDILRARLTSE